MTRFQAFIPAIASVRSTSALSSNCSHTCAYTASGAPVARLDAGTYGRCAQCGQPIAGPRLQAVPWAKLCVHCQELAEQGLLPEA